MGEVKELLKEDKEITKDKVNEMTSPEDLPDDEIMMPVDMRGLHEDEVFFVDVDEMMAKLGPTGTARGFMKAAEYFEANKHKLTDEELPKEMTAKEWSRVLEEEEEDESGEEDFLEGEEEEDEVENEDEGDEPALKKAKTQ